MTSTFDLFLVALAERMNRLWGHYLKLNIQFRPNQPFDRYGVEVMVGLPAQTTWQVIQAGESMGLAVIDVSLLLGAIDRQLGGRGIPPKDLSRPLTILEESLGRKLVEKLLPGFNEVWQGFSSELPPIELVEMGEGFRSPWDPTESVVETSFMGGWSGCQGMVRFFWPKAFVDLIFKDLKLERVDVDQWQARPWGNMPLTIQENIHENPPQRITKTPKVEKKPAQTSKKKRIAFDDFDAMIAALGQD